MSESEAVMITEKFLKEMLEADDAADYDLYVKRYENKYLENFNREIFQEDIEGIHERNGVNKGYEFLGTLRSSRLEDVEVYRTVWKGIYDKRDAIIEFGVYRKNGDWYVIQSAVY